MIAVLIIYLFFILFFQKNRLVDEEVFDNRINKKYMESKMTAEEIVLGGYKNFAEGDMESLSKIYHPECKITINGNHSLSGTYIGFQSFLENVLARLDKVWPGFNLDIEKVVSNETDVCVFVNITAENLNSKSIHHFVNKDGLEVEFNLYDDSQKMSQAMKDIN